MATGKKINITSDLLDNLENSIGLVDLVTEQDFIDVLKLDRTIVYILVNWSGPERFSRYYVYNSLNEMDKTATPIFKIDCSDQQKKYIVDWLIEQRQNKKDFFYGGLGETLLISKGGIIDFIKNPGQLGQQKTKKKLEGWLKHNNIDL